MQCLHVRYYHSHHCFPVCFACTKLFFTFVFFSYFLDYECPYARFLAIHDSSKDVFIHYWLGHVLGLSIVCNESSGNGGSRFRCKQTGEKSLHKFIKIAPCALTLLLLQTGVIHCQKTSKNFCQLISEMFRLWPFHQMRAAASFLFVYLLQWILSEVIATKKQKLQSTIRNACDCLRWSTLENHTKMYCDHLDTCSSCIQYSAHFFAMAHPDSSTGFTWTKPKITISRRQEGPVQYTATWQSTRAKRS